MTHLTDDQAAAIALGEADAAHEAHAAGCATCAARVRACADTLHDVAALDVPEPPPLFWSQFANRVTQAIDETNAKAGDYRPGAPAAAQAPGHAWMGIAAALILAVAALLVSSRSNPPSVQDLVLPPATDASVANLEGEDEAWAVVQSVTSDLRYEDARDAGIAPRPGAVERAAEELSDEERAELVRLLHAEIDAMKKLGV
jgi:hypothetical protein